MLRFSFIVVMLLWVVGARPQAAVFHGSPAHTGIYSSTHSSIGNLKWKFYTGNKIVSSPAASGDMVYFGCEDHSLYAVNKHSGKLVWKFVTGGAVSSSPAVYKNAVYFGSYDGYYYAVNTTTGKLAWKFKTGGEKRVGSKSLWTMKPKDIYMEDPFDFFLSSPVIGTESKNPIVYFGSSDGNLYAVDAGTGEKKWSYQTDGLIHSSPALYDGKVYFGSWDRYLYALDATTGKLAWKFQTRDQPGYHLLEGIQSSPACTGGVVYFGCRDGFFYALNAKTGKLAWKYDAKGSWVLTTPAIKDGTVYFGTSDTFLFVALDAKTGKEKFAYKTHGYIYSSAVLTNTTAYFGDFTGSLLAIDTRSGNLSGTFFTPGHIANSGNVLNKLQDIDFSYLAGGRDLSLYSSTVYGMARLYTLGPIVSSPVISDDILYFGSTEGYLYALKLQ